MDELDGAMSDHVLRLEPQDRSYARTDLDEGAKPVGDQDQVLGRLEDALALLALALQRALRALAVGDVAGDLGGADDLAIGGLQGRDSEDDVDLAAVLVAAGGLLLLDADAVADARQDLCDLVVAPLRYDQVDALAH